MFTQFKSTTKTTSDNYEIDEMLKATCIAVRMANFTTKDFNTGEPVPDVPHFSMLFAFKGKDGETCRKWTRNFKLYGFSDKRSKFFALVGGDAKLLNALSLDNWGEVFGKQFKIMISEDKNKNGEKTGYNSISTIKYYPDTEAPADFFNLKDNPPLPTFKNFREVSPITEMWVKLEGGEAHKVEAEEFKQREELPLDEEPKEEKNTDDLPF